MKILIKPVCLVACLFLCGGALASTYDLRVLLRFDDAGHHVEKIVRTKQDNTFTATSRQSNSARVFPDFDALREAVRPGVASLIWLDDQGYVISVTTAPDPRVSHSPAHIAGVNESRLASESGAWLVSGPEETVKLLIMLPINVSPALAAEQWEVLL